MNRMKPPLPGRFLILQEAQLPYNGSGTFTLAEAAFVPNTPISSSAMNSDLSDIATNGLTNAVTKDGQTVITGAFKGASGSVGLPMYSFSADQDSGMYRIGANNVGISVNATKILDIATTGLSITGNATVSGVLTASVAGLDIIGATQLTSPAANDTLLIYDLSATANRRILVSDFLKVVNDLTADATPDGAADYVLTYDASASAAKKVLLANLPTNSPRGYIDGLILTNGTDATNDINIAPGICRDSTNTVDIIISTALGKQLDANWAVGGTTGSPAGMRNSAAGIANGTYHLYAVRTAASTAGDIYAYAGVAGTNPDSSASITTVLTALQAETGGGSYIYARRVGSIMRESASIAAFVQDGDYFTRTGTITPVSGSPFAIPDANGHLVTLAIPLGIRARAVVFSESTSAVFLLLSDPSVTDQAATAGTANSGLSGANQTEVWTNTSSQIRYRANSATGNLNLETLGWMDKRGQNA